jgi:hypothetical protein
MLPSMTLLPTLLAASLAALLAAGTPARRPGVARKVDPVVAAARRADTVFNWRPETVLRLDLDGDGRKDGAVLGSTEGQAALALVLEPEGAQPKAWVFPFGAPPLGDGLCSAPGEVKIAPDELRLPLEAHACGPKTAQLPHCQLLIPQDAMLRKLGKKGAKGVVVRSGKCAPRHYFWHSEARNFDSWLPPENLDAPQGGK